MTSRDPTGPAGSAPHHEKPAPDFDLRRPTPTEISGFFLGGTIGTYVGGPIGTLIGMVVGFVASSIFEHYLDSTATPETKSRK